MSSLTPQVMFNVEPVSPTLTLGEGPHWHPPTQSLYFVELFQGKINRYHPETNGYFSASIEGYNGIVSLVIPIEFKPDTFVVGLGSSIGTVEWDGRSNKTSRPKYMKLIDDTPGNNLNDGKVDAIGRLWIDTYKYMVEAHDFDIASGDLSNRKVIFDLSVTKIESFPDGITINRDGNLWLACFNSNQESFPILKIDPNTGTLLMTVQLPAYQITSVASGPELDQLYMTTGSIWLTEEQKCKQPYSGALLRVTNTGSTGFAGVSAKYNLCPVEN
ncbi:Six-bladed beta-propeller, TolB-like,SMP-30/Gluconolactonase/LRE-like region,Senescence marker [Cinara cedri]|uniref:Six-bladed beta-propeller, TolB-like,SMP-30/Gluconolactonase/LRE-like region,Senescence marker n=1 Tax=Cinara cedri TaxID=506608 RepID=A0A5E4MUK1_9HEMI|nr:Six-bladed beta-propeller, TolB-like,SMP-30/Gluconolactonase/LRE-like region,Senescence marker [Cinara cedri]